MKKNNNGFTLVEIVVVVVILVVLASFLIPTITKYLTKSNDEKNQEDAKNIYNSAQIALYDLYSRSAHDGNYRSIIEGTDNKNPGVIESNWNYSYKGKSGSLKVFVSDIHNKKDFPVSADIFINASYKVKVNNKGQWKSDIPYCVFLITGDYKTYCSPELDTFNPKKAYTIYGMLFNQNAKGDFFLMLNDGTIVYPKNKDEFLATIDSISDPEDSERKLVKQIYVLKGAAGDDQDNDTMWKIYAQANNDFGKKAYAANQKK